MATIQAHAPFTAFSAADAQVGSPQRIAIGSQDGTVLVFQLSQSRVVGPIQELRTEDGLESSSGDASSPAMSVTVLHWGGPNELYAGWCGRCCCWDLASGTLRREFLLPGAERPATPSTLAAVRLRAHGNEAEMTHLWAGLDTGNISVFDAVSGILTRSISCSGPETIVAITYFEATDVVFALSAHRRVGVWEASTYACLQKYPAELMTCGADLCAMTSAELQEPDLSLLLLAGIDGSLCVRRVTRRPDGKINCVLLCYMESVGADPGCPITSMQYHAATDSLLVGNAGCSVSLLNKFRDQLGSMALTPGDLPVGAPQRVTAASGEAPPSGALAAAAGQAPLAGLSERPREGDTGIAPVAMQMNCAALPIAPATEVLAADGRHGAPDLEPRGSVGVSKGKDGGGGNGEGAEAGVDPAPFPVFRGE